VEFTMTMSDYEALGGHMDAVLSLEEVYERKGADRQMLVHNTELPWPWRSPK
jgi:hypothetical protein